MPADDVSDLRDVVDAINKLCDTMKSSNYDDIKENPEPTVETQTMQRYTENETHDKVTFKLCHVKNLSNTGIDINVPVHTVEASEKDNTEKIVLVSETDDPKKTVEGSRIGIPVQTVETSAIEIPDNVLEASEEVVLEKTVESFVVSIPVQIVDEYENEAYDQVADDVSETEQLVTVCEPMSEYYTASSEVSLVSDDMSHLAKDNYAESLMSDEIPVGMEESGDGRDSVTAGHVAAMREKFESMTRTNTPCPDLMRSVSPFELFRKTPSPDHLDKIN
ncbi:uncharacterized protein LOC126972854 [Leptidea sinapis]|uniref:uncharacterized protein LOC126972854 n=1 Tax=Leptidea sinapis TaxID=189913 RepID=UPI0021C47E73|nr:uncharacterized protein LOC126972854 [Leptidea sinapis]